MLTQYPAPPRLNHLVSILIMIRLNKPVWPHPSSKTPGFRRSHCANLPRIDWQTWCSTKAFAPDLDLFDCLALASSGIDKEFVCRGTLWFSCDEPCEDPVTKFEDTMTKFKLDLCKCTTCKWPPQKLKCVRELFLSIRDLVTFRSKLNYLSLMWNSRYYGLLYRILICKMFIFIK